MKVLFLADVNSSHTRKWVLGLVSKGVEVSIFSMSTPREDWYTDLNIEVGYFGANQKLQDKQSAFAKFSYLKAVKEVKQFVKKINPSILHAHYATSYGLLGALSRRKPYVISVWGSDIQDFPYRSILHKRILKFVFSKADMVCSTSESMLKDIDYVGTRNRIKIPFGINIEEFKKKNHLDIENLKFGTVKTMDHVYGVDHLIRAFKVYLDQTGRMDTLELYGKGPQTESLKVLAKSLNIEDNVHFNGYVLRKNIASAYQSLDVYLSLSRRESYGVAALEASASALPLITSTAEGFDEVVEEGKSGFKVKVSEGNYQKVVDRMIQLQNFELRNSMGNYGRQRVISDFDFQNDLEKQIEVYRELLSK